MLNILKKIGMDDNTVMYAAMGLRHETGCKIIGDTLKNDLLLRDTATKIVCNLQKEQNEIRNENENSFICIQMNK